MARDFNDAALRERIRHNIGRLQASVELLAGPITAGRYGTVFRNGELIVGTEPGADGAPTPSVPVLPSVPQGRIMGVCINTANGLREVAVSDTLPSPAIIRALTLTGDYSIADANSFRIMLALDSDTTAVAVPTGVDLISFTSDVVGAEDVGVHANLLAGPLVVEPWRKILSAGYRLKLKVHNLSGGVRNIALYADLDDLTS